MVAIESKHKKLPATQRQVEHELNLYYSQSEALDNTDNKVISPDEKNVLQEYYQSQIRTRLKLLSEFLKLQNKH